MDSNSRFSTRGHFSAFCARMEACCACDILAGPMVWDFLEGGLREDREGGKVLGSKPGGYPPTEKRLVDAGDFFVGGFFFNVVSMSAGTFRFLLAMDSSMSRVLAALRIRSQREDELGVGGATASVDV